MSDLETLRDALDGILWVHSEAVRKVKATLAPDIDLDLVIDQLVAVNQERDASAIKAIDAYLKRNGTVRATIKDL